jgi:hypothetical protein
LASRAFSLSKDRKTKVRNHTGCNSVVEHNRRKEVTALSILWIILIIVLVLALLGFFSRGAW